MMQPGRYDDLSNAEYHGGVGTSKSGLDLLHKCPDLFKWAGEHREERQPTPAQEFGTAYHMIVLEPAEFVRTYCLALRPQDVPGAIEDRDVLVGMVAKLNESRRPKLPTTGDKATLVARILEAEAADYAAGTLDAAFMHSEAGLSAMKGDALKAILVGLNESRQGLLPISGTRHELADLLRANGTPVTLWSDVQAEWLKNNGHRTVLSGEDWDTLHAMRDKLMAHPAAAAILRRPGRAETSFYWVDPETGETMRCRPDWLTDCGILGDLKTTEDASPQGFKYSIQKYRYDVQHPLYMDGIGHAIKQARLDMLAPRRFVFIGQEKKPPYLVGVYELDPEDVELGRMEYRADLYKLRECRTTDKWPGYGDGVQRISLTQWHRQETAIAASATIH